MVITIIGAGQMGSAMCFPAMDNGCEVRLVGTMLDREIISSVSKDGWHPTLKRRLPGAVACFQLEELDEALKGAEFVIGGVSSFGVEWFRDTIIPALPKKLPVLSITKGMLDLPDGSLLTYPAIYSAKDSGRPFCAVGGPCTSYELADKDMTHICFCGDDISTLRMMKSALATSYYHISLSTDVTGVECAVAMKNAYALGVTLAVGISERMSGTQHYNSQAALFGQSVREMRKLLKLLGGCDDNIVYGAGDLYVTVFGGRTRKIGTLLGRGMDFQSAMKELEGITLESIVIATRTARAVRARISQGTATASDFPLLLHIDDIITNGASVDIPWSAFETE